MLTFKGKKDGIIQAFSLGWDVHGAPGVNEKLVLDFIFKINFNTTSQLTNMRPKTFRRKEKICMSSNINDITELTNLT